MSPADHVIQWLNAFPGRSLARDADGTWKATEYTGKLAAVSISIEGLAALMQHRDHEANPLFNNRPGVPGVHADPVQHPEGARPHRD